MDKILLETIQELKKAVAKIEANMLTKSDAKNFLTKSDAKNFATKDDLKNFATKDDLENVKDELLKKLAELDKMQMAIFKSVEATKEDRIVVEKLTKRVDRLEEKVFA